jgi:hypothetical protein
MVVDKPQEGVYKVLNDANIDFLRTGTMYACTKLLHTDEVRLRVLASQLLQNFLNNYCIFLCVLRYVG